MFRIPPVLILVLQGGSFTASAFASRHHSIIVHQSKTMTRLHATKKNKKHKQGNARRSCINVISGNGFGSNNAESKSATRTEEIPSKFSAAPVSKSSLLSEQQEQPRIRALRQLSTEPLIFTIDDFVSTGTCLALMQHENEEARLKFASQVASELFAGQWGKNDGLRFNKASSSDANNKKSADHSCYPEGLHVDTNNDSIYRSVTLILYLNDVPVECGGATAFPLAGVEKGDSLLDASNRLLKGGVGHTRGRATEEGLSNGGECGVLLPSQEADALFLEQQKQQSSSRGGVCVAPQEGRLCIFFSRTSDGEIDPRSWHAGERLIGHHGTITEKKILTLFKEVSYGTTLQHPEDETESLEDYLAPQIAEQREAPQALARVTCRFLRLAKFVFAGVYICTYLFKQQHRTLK